jgi:hypothetical protein
MDPAKGPFVVRTYWVDPESGEETISIVGPFADIRQVVAALQGAGYKADDPADPLESWWGRGIEIVRLASEMPSEG